MRTILRPSALLLFAALLVSTTAVRAQPAAPPAPAASLAPTNQAADHAVATIAVTVPGMQRITGAELAAAGVNLAALTPEKLHLWRAGQPVALEERGTGDGRLDAGDELRFYALPPGDRWNAGDTYWLTVEAVPGLRMATRSVAPAGAPARTTALERGTWRANQLYDSTQPGPDGDHWFAADLRTGPGQEAAALTVPLSATLPLAGGPMTVTVTAAAFTPGVHILEATGGGTSARATWSGAGATTRIMVVGAAERLDLALLPGAAPDGLEIDAVAWERATALTFGGRGAVFAGLPGNWRYQLAGLTAGQELYDITDPPRPQRLTGVSDAFQDGPAARAYLLAGQGTLHTPAVRRYAPLPLPATADVIYIAPAALHDALAPLVAHRQAQGHAAAAVDVQALYDRWSYGQVAPEAIRAFLRYAAAMWASPPRAAVLVGDGTSDPLNYTGRGNATLIPPYLADVDPWLGEAACETCFAQLDGDDPLSDPLPDLAIGRLPVKSAAELTALAAKIIGYETAPGGMDWRARALLLADNGVEADGTPDGAGDFAALSDAAIDLLPPGATAVRLYYDPWKRDSAGSPRPDPWREPDAAQARARTIAAFGEGAGIVTYMGHAHQWQWAVTDPAAPDGALLGLYDADALANSGRLPIVLALSCLSSAFQTPAYSGTTIDERLLLAPGGGAIAVWGSAGLGVAHGHDALQRGFLRALWADPQRTPTIGELTLAGYREVHATASCCYDLLRTFVLLGDPMTPARVPPPAPVFLPAVRR
ncbi:MAG TPA: C25 family cysteine peptidase [Roseiflexaceae bacterium]|nr:C25 family cysteine peptidase [Roseiflexaceae bacterium]